MKNAEAAKNPTQLKTRRTGKQLPLILGGGAVTIMLLILVFGILNRGEEQAELVTQEVVIDLGNAISPVQPDGAGLASVDPNLEIEITEPVAEQQELPPITVITQKPPSREEEQFRAEKQRIRAWRIGKQREGLEAPLRVAVMDVPSHSRTQGEGSSASGSVSSGSRMDAGTARRLDSLKGDLANLSQGNPGGANGPDTSFTPSEWTSPHSREGGAEFELKTGGVIPGIMLTGINSQLPGQITAQVSQNVYDTATGDYLLVPQGTRLLGFYDSKVSAGQERIFVAWNRLIFPDGSAMILGEFPGADHAGYSGLSDEVNNHYLRLFGNAALMAIITGGMAYAVDSFMPDNDDDDDSPSLQSEMGSELASRIGQASMALLEKNLSIAPTLTIRPGFRFNIVVIKDLVFTRPYEGWR